MLEKIFRKLYDTLDMESLQKRTEIINSFERIYGQKNFSRSAFCCAEFMKAAGLKEVKMIPLACDGKTAYLDCIMPQAWDLEKRSFFKLDNPSLSPDDAMLCDTAISHFAAGMWSMPTPAGGISGEIVDWDNLDPAKPDVKGKIVLLKTPRAPWIYKTCVEHGALAMLFCDAKKPDAVPDDYRWSNGIGRVGWYHTKEDKRGIFFNLTPRKADFLKTLLASGKKVCGHGELNSKVWDDTIHTVTGIVPGESKEEVLLVAHLYEPFLPDDAAGAAQCIAVAGTISELCRKGVLPPLKKTLRIVLSMELYGFSEWYSKPERRKKICHVFSFDSTCHLTQDKKGVRHPKLRRTFDGAPSFTDWILADALDNVPGVEYVNEAGNLSDDTFPSEPMTGIPSNWIHSGDMNFHHNSSRFFMEADWGLAQIASAATGTAIAVLSCFGKKEFADLLPKLVKQAVKEFREMLNETGNAVKAGRYDGTFARARAAFLMENAVKRILNVNKYAGKLITPSEAKAPFEALLSRFLNTVPAAKETSPGKAAQEAARMKITLLRQGTLVSFAAVPWKERTFAGDFADGNLVRAFCDGKSTLYEAMQKKAWSFETPYTEKDYKAAVNFFRKLEKYGYLEITRQ